MMLKILHIIPSLNKGGAERLVLDICNELKKRQEISVKLITFHTNNAYSFLTDTIDWEVIPSSITPSITGKTHVDVLKLQQVIENFQPDVIHSHLFESEMVLSQINYPKAKYFAHFHDNMIQFENLSFSTIPSKQALTNAFEKRILLKSYKKRSVKFIGISVDTLTYMQKVLPITFQKAFLHNAIDLKRFQLGSMHSEQTRIVMIGSLVDKKGQALAIEAISELRKRGLVIFLDLLGEGPNREHLVVLIKNNKLNDQVILHGNVDHPEHFLKQATLYLHTAFYEPFGLVLIEAMACGLPVVCTDGKGNRDLINEGENGFMVWERDPKLLADKIELLLKDDERRLKMGQNARRFAEGFGIEKYVDELLQLYSSL